ncbi:MAG: hypothetical protein LKCHEGNO_00235 [Burkholderiaceae bacterium]|nr:hypothetical protein [Burkholderiaceae bacterium]
MKSTLVLAAIGLLAAAASATPLSGPRAGSLPGDRAHGAATSMPCASDELAHRHRDRDRRRDPAHGVHDRNDGKSNHGMQAVPTRAGPGESAYGWRYFTEPSAHRAVVISPQGEYYYSHGEGLRLVAVTQPAS